MTLEARLRGIVAAVGSIRLDLHAGELTEAVAHGRALEAQVAELMVELERTEEALR